MSVSVDLEPAEITWDESGVEVLYGSETEWSDSKLTRRLAIWGNER